MADRTHTFQAPRGTRDFYPADLAIKRHLEDVWREVSINHGFDEIDGPTFEHLELYTAKSGEGIVNELFSFQRTGGSTTYALRPEFTPTLARMYAARAGQLPKPVKWFCIPSFFRAERPQRGRLREFFQWNADIIGVGADGELDTRLDVEVISLLVDCLRKFGFGPDQVRIKLGHRSAIEDDLLRNEYPQDRHEGVFNLLDARAKTSAEEYRAKASSLGLPEALIEKYDPVRGIVVRLDDDPASIGLDPQAQEEMHKKRETPGELFYELKTLKLDKWCEFDSMVVRGLAYYTGLVFEAHEASGSERAIAGGGRYDKLIGLFGGPPTPAVGFAMGDVVLRLLLEDRGLLNDPGNFLPQPDVFVINTLDDDRELRKIVAELRREEISGRHSYRATKNVGKLLGDANKCRARYALILGKNYDESKTAELKNLDTGEQEEIPLAGDDDVKQLAGRMKP